jgi:L-2-hydroxycarboxylate dehydrogenase (NAD+)
MTEVCFLSTEILHQFAFDVFVGCGIPDGDAKICADVLIASDQRGIESHGIGRLRLYYDNIKKNRQKPVTELEVVNETPNTAVVDGHQGMGQVIGVRSMQMAIDKAGVHGLGAVAARNSSHFGIDGYYTLMAVKAGMIGMSFTNARPSVAPTFGTRPMLGTNPIAFGAPTDEDCPFLFDAATSIAQRGKIEILDREGEPTPEGWVINPEGKYLTDTSQLIKGFATETSAILPIGGLGELMGGHKGFGLSVMVEILCSALQNNLSMHHLPAGAALPVQVGHFFLAINIENFIPLEEFKSNVGAILRELRTSRRVPGQERIYTAGEKEFEMEKYTASHGVPVTPGLQADLKFLQAEMGLWQYQFPF